MTFPHYFEIFGLRLHPHAVMELLAYVLGMQFYLFLRKRWPRVTVPFEKQAWIIVGCVAGAMVGSKILAILESPAAYFSASSDLIAVMAGKTIVGGLLGGWIGVEIAKRIVGVRESTGDPVVFPLILGMCIGRIGCFLTGLSDHTYGVHSTLPWAVDFGDGRRHPTQLYEIVFLLILAVVLAIRLKRETTAGQVFRLFMVGYLGFRFLVDFIKPRTTYLGISAIQIACLAGIAFSIFSMMQLRLDSHASAAGAIDPLGADGRVG